MRQLFTSGVKVYPFRQSLGPWSLLSRELWRQPVTDRKTRLALQWLECKEACERAGYDGSVEYAKDYIELAEPELLMNFKDVDAIKTYAQEARNGLHP
ncbi:hypothetical protein [Dyadobacter frigoris]|uniref:Uncharacterized protein n=1 Tax=Dyadobacter frigoris TaxID=2576211 RepID=A0A4U6CLU3_9BACT|nr:hypothetical protein [Dyadobacter frigoris]TKT85250.1 hypothetical protein FDK13_34220 [Dyadobacter frigoris]